MENKPDVLYRGVKVNYNDLQDFQFSGIDLIVNYDPIIDQYGRKTVIDGNEYGVYMSDNLSMVKSAYGDLHSDGMTIHKNLSIYNERIMIPSVAVIYQINTNGIDVRRPFISDQLKGHYNNGFQGDEYIADIVPASNYTIYRVRIGSDILHDAEDIDISRIENISELVKQKLEMRKYRLEMFANAMERISPVKRSFIGRDELNILKSIYGENGIKYINEDSLFTSDVDGMLKYLVAKVFKQNELDIDYQTIKYINGLKGQATNVDSIIEILKNDKIKNMQEKVAFVEKKEQEGVSYTTNLFDKKDKRLADLMSIIILRRNSEFKKAEEQENHVLPEEQIRREKLNRPKLRIEVIRSVVLRNNSKRLKKLKNQVIEENTIIEEFVEDEFDHGMSM